MAYKILLIILLSFIVFMDIKFMNNNNYHWILAWMGETFMWLPKGVCSYNTTVSYYSIRTHGHTFYVQSGGNGPPAYCASWVTLLTLNGYDGTHWNTMSSSPRERWDLCLQIGQRNHRFDFSLQKRWNTKVFLISSQLQWRPSGSGHPI